MKTLILTALLSATVFGATGSENCLQDHEKNLISMLEPSEVQALLEDKTCSVAEGIDFGALADLKEEVETLNKGSK